MQGLLAYFKKCKTQYKEVQKDDTTSKIAILKELLQNENGKFQSYENSNKLMNYTMFEYYAPDRNTY